MSSELEDDFDPNTSANSDDKVDSVLIKKILYEMKSEFNRGMCNIPNQLKDEPDDALTINSLESDDIKENGFSVDSESRNNDRESHNESFNSDDPGISEDSHNLTSTSQDGNNDDTKDPLPKDEESDSVSSEKVLDETVPSKKKPKTVKEAKKTKISLGSPFHDDNNASAERKSRRSVKGVEKPDAEIALKRSSRRMSKEYSRESVLQNAIARKEKSFSSFGSMEEKPRRPRTSDDKPKNKAGSKAALPKSDEQPVKSLSESLKVSPLKGKLTSPISSEVNGNDSDNENGFPNSPLKKNIKTSPTQDNGHAEVLNNITSSHQLRNDWDKGVDSLTNFSSGVKAKKKSFSFSQESYQPLAKRPRPDSTSTIPEASDVPPHEPSLPLMTWSERVICECQQVGGFYPSKSSLRGGRGFCKALDSFEDRIVGCVNMIGEDTPLLRPSRTVPLLLMCDVHISRLQRHNCCPTCGLFCIQGNVVQCKNKHFFHKECALKKDEIPLCPHCNNAELADMKLSLSAHQYPILLPTQKVPNKSSARMGMTRSSYPELDLKEEEELNDIVPQGDHSNSKRKISTDGLPNSDKEKIRRLLYGPPSKNDMSQRFSGRGFYQACKHGDIEKVFGMLGSYNKDNGSLLALHAAAGNGHLAIVHLLVQYGMPLEVLDKSQYTPLMLATLNGHNAIVKYLVKAGADVAFKGSDGMTALHLAAQVGNLVACHCLLSATKKPPSFVNVTDDGNWTPLVWAAENSHSQVVRYLLEKKADPQIEDTEMNIALHWSAFAGSPEISEDLLNYGSNINACNSHGDSPLHIAARQGAENCLMLLLSRGALPDVKNKAGQLPIDCVLPEFPYCKIAIELNMKIKSLASKSFFHPRILSKDISQGHEMNPIQCVNNVNSEQYLRDFVYITENCVTSNLPIDRRISTLMGCICEETCSSSSCACGKKSFRCWYDSSGKLSPEFNFDDPPMIFECNQTCTCNALTCKNRVVQRGLKVRLQVYKTKKKNWGVTTLREIPKGTYVCEYIGEIISDCEADTREDDSYLFDLDNRDGESYCIDACKYGNVTRFINHSCRPNLVPVRIFVGHHDLQFPRIAFFAARDIAPNEELGFDYGEKFWIIKYKNFTCSCEELNCRYSSETIHDTLEKYKERLKLEESL